MKNVKQIKQKSDLLSNTDSHEERKLVTLIRSGLLDASKLPILKRAMSKEQKVLTPVERNTLLDLLNSLMTQVLTSNPIYTKMRQNVMNEGAVVSTYRMLPSILVLKRQAIRVYPGGKNVGLYYANQIDRYVAIPFDQDNKSILNMTEEFEELNEISKEKRDEVFAKRVVATRRTKGLVKTKNLKKAAKVALRTVEKGAREVNPEKGIEDYKAMQGFADRYDDALKATKQGSVKIKPKRTVKRTTQPLATQATPHSQPAEPANPREPKRPSAADYLHIKQKRQGDRDKKLRVIRKQSRDSYYNDKALRGTNLIGDTIKHMGYEHMVGHVVGKQLYRMVRPNPVPKPKAVNEGFKDVLARVKQRLANTFRKSGKSEDEEGSTNSSGKKRTVFKKIKNDHQSKLSVSTSGLNNDRARRVQNAMMPSLFADKREKDREKELQQQQQMGEGWKADLALDAASLLPGPGNFISGGLAVRDLAKGDYVGAGLNALGAIPVAGNAFKGVKMGVKGVKTVKAAKAAKTAVKAAKAVDKVSDATKAAKLAKQSVKTAKMIDKTADATKAVKAVDKAADATKAVKVAKGAKAASKGGKMGRWAKRLGKGAALGAGLAAVGGFGSSRGGVDDKADALNTSKLRITTSGLDQDRMRRVQRSMDPTFAREDVEVELDGNRYLLNTSVVNKVLNMYHTLTEDNRRKMVEKMNESDESLQKIISFAVRH